jgi:hypothetical protein
MGRGSGCVDRVSDAVDAAARREPTYEIRVHVSASIQQHHRC